MRKLLLVPVVRAKVGKITLVFKNPSMLQHDVRLEIGEKEYGGTKTPACPARSSSRRTSALRALVEILLQEGRGVRDAECALPAGPVV